MLFTCLSSKSITDHPIDDTGLLSRCRINGILSFEITCIRAGETTKEFFDYSLIGIVGIPASLLLQMVLLQIEQRFLGQSLSSQNTQNIVQLIMNNMIFILATTFAGPIMEEFVFRRAIFGALEKRFGFFFPALLSSALFAFAHNDGHYLLYAGLGFLFCGMYRYSGRIWTSMITHVGMNLLVILTQLALQSS